MDGWMEECPTLHYKNLAGVGEGTSTTLWRYSTSINISASV